MPRRPTLLKAVASLLPAIGDHPQRESSRGRLRLGAAGNERVERLIEHIRQKSSLALPAFQAMIHRRGLVHHHHDGGRHARLILLGNSRIAPPRKAATATCNNGDLHAANGLNAAVRCSARQGTRFKDAPPDRSSHDRDHFVFFSRDMQHLCN